VIDLNGEVGIVEGFISIILLYVLLIVGVAIYHYSGFGKVLDSIVPFLVKLPEWAKSTLKFSWYIGIYVFLIYLMT
jgi:hypothetical protein